MEGSKGRIRGSFQPHRKWELSIASMEASIATTEVSMPQGSELRRRQKLRRKQCKLLETLMEPKQAPMKVVEASKASVEASWKRPVSSAEAASIEASTETA